MPNPQLICDHCGVAGATYTALQIILPEASLEESFPSSSHDMQEKIKDGMQNLIHMMHVATAFNLTRPSRPLRLLPKLIAATVYRHLAKKGAPE